jgi:hypothetical protein
LALVGGGEGAALAFTLTTLITGIAWLVLAQVFLVFPFADCKRLRVARTVL